MEIRREFYSGIEEILLIADHYVALPVMIGDEGIQARSDGRKIIPRGTIVGGGDPTAEKYLVKPINDTAAKASLTTDFSKANSNLVFTARAYGAAGNNITIAYVDPGAPDEEASVTVSGSAIAINLATDETGELTTTANGIIALVLEHPEAKLLVDVRPAVGNTGSGLVEELAAVNLAGGADGSESEAQGILFNDIDVTYGERTAAMIVHGFIRSSKLPIPPSAAVKKALVQIHFQ